MPCWQQEWTYLRKKIFQVTALHVSARTGHLLAIESFLARGANINEQSSDGSTALHVAVKNRRGEVVYSLLEAGAKVDLVNYEGKTELAKCCYIIVALIEAAGQCRKIVEHKRVSTSEYDGCLG